MRALNWLEIAVKNSITFKGRVTSTPMTNILEEFTVTYAICIFVAVGLMEKCFESEFEGTESIEKKLFNHITFAQIFRSK